MSTFTRNLLLAALFSLSGIAATYSIFRYYDNLANSMVPAGTKSLAHLTSAHNEVQKRAAKKVIWQRLDEDEALYSGESVRTLPDSEAVIVFDSGTEVDLDPESVVEINDSNGKVNLDFIKGNLFVKGGESTGNGSAVTLSSGQNRIDLKNADMSVAKTGNNLDAQVMRGSVEVTQGSNKITLDKEKLGRIGEYGVDVTQRFFKIKNPGSNNKTYIRVDKNEMVQFAWVPLESDYEVKLLTGTKRDNLLTTTDSVPGNLGELYFKLKPGAVFWQLLALNKKDPRKVYSSPIARVTIIAEIPPKLLSPLKDATVLITSNTPQVDLRWANPSKVDRLHLEVSKDPKFQKTFFSEEVEDTGVHAVTPTEEGEYYWRISGFRPGSAVSVTSDSQKFMLRTKIQLFPPSLKSPVQAAHIPYEKIKDGSVYLSWNPILGIPNYRVTIESVEDPKKGARKTAPIIKETDANQIRLQQISPGSYAWSVISIDEEENLSKSSEARTLFIEDLAKLLWADGKDTVDYWYVTPKPTLQLSWKPFSSAVALNQNFKITIKHTDKPDRVLMSKIPAQLIEVPEDGVYQVLAEEVDEKGFALMRSALRTVTVKLRPLLKAPAFSERMPANLSAQKNGALEIYWNSVIGARSTIVEIKNGAGKIVKHEKFNGTVGSFKGLLPGSYFIHLASVDEYGRVGEIGETKSLVVPNQSDLKPPLFKRLNVK